VIFSEPADPSPPSPPGWYIAASNASGPTPFNAPAVQTCAKACAMRSLACGNWHLPASYLNNSQRITYVARSAGYNCTLHRAGATPAIMSINGTSACQWQDDFQSSILRSPTSLRGCDNQHKEDGIARLCCCYNPDDAFLHAMCPHSSPSCTDGVQNGNETGIDCGGPCQNECPQFCRSNQHIKVLRSQHCTLDGGGPAFTMNVGNQKFVLIGDRAYEVNGDQRVGPNLIKYPTVVAHLNTTGNMSRPCTLGESDDGECECRNQLDTDTTPFGVVDLSSCCSTAVDGAAMRTACQVQCRQSQTCHAGSQTGAILGWTVKHS
jgi:hypothetical protein